jgi:hypothetical protein
MGGDVPKSLVRGKSPLFEDVQEQRAGLMLSALRGATGKTLPATTVVPRPPDLLWIARQVRKTMVARTESPLTTGEAP